MNIQEGIYFWSTEHAHDTNNDTMHDFIDYHLDVDKFDLTYHDGTYAEITDRQTGKEYEVHASGNGDFYNHKVEFKELVG